MPSSGCPVEAPLFDSQDPAQTQVGPVGGMVPVNLGPHQGTPEARTTAPDAPPMQALAPK